MELAFVDKLASQVNYLLVAVNFFARYVRIQTMETKYAKAILLAFKEMISRKNNLEKLLVDEGTEYGRTFKKTLQGGRP